MATENKLFFPLSLFSLFPFSPIVPFSLTLSSYLTLPPSLPLSPLSLPFPFSLPPPFQPQCNSLSLDDLREALLAMVKTKDEVEERNR